MPLWLPLLLLAGCSAGGGSAAATDGDAKSAEAPRADAAPLTPDPPAGNRPPVAARKLSTETKHALKARETISELARMRYGSRHYSRLIVLFNDFRDPSKLSIGTVVELPELGEILSASGATSVAGEQLSTLLDVRERWLTIEPAIGQAFERATEVPDAASEGEIVLDDAADPSPGGQAPTKDPFATHSDIPGQDDGAPPPEGRGTPTVAKRPSNRFAPLSVSLEADLISALEPMAGELETAADALDELDDETVRPPKKTAQELRNAAKLMRALIAGEPPGNFDLDDIHQHLANAMINAVLWGRKGYR